MLILLHQARDHPDFVFWQQRRTNIQYTDMDSHSLCHCRIIAREHDGFELHGVQCRNHFGAVLAHFVRHRDITAHPFAIVQKHGAEAARFGGFNHITEFRLMSISTIEKGV